ncbi:PREDICTED: protein SAR DEFICIENT 1-like [Ipomoea nil]|uniref:protein SAR DEFICIENT 1-like n=1 Tax=Ipomoea nil TaxID=35883 RepID=UPI0009015E45|nr:PREDICTED: protein SAR DEFICIENT 1-like [Ipomoea nil]
MIMPNSNQQPNPKRIRPSLASVIKEVVTMKCLENFCSDFEPMVRKVVQEEVENAVRRLCSPSSAMISSSSLLKTHNSCHGRPPALSLIFRQKLAVQIFTGTRILAEDGATPLEIMLVDTSGGSGLIPAALPFPVKLEVVVLDGDFPPDGEVAGPWTTHDFNKNVVKERTGKRPLLAGDSFVSMTDGSAHLSNNIEFTDNSSWIRCRRFRLGARVVHAGNAAGGQSVNIREAITNSFMVKDHRGELYKKHYPPALDDDVWRLKNIGKDGKFHKKLASNGVNTVQHFLQLSEIDCNKLRSILGGGMSDKMWDVTYKHASTCEIGNKLYISQGDNYILFLNPICQVVRANVDGQIFASAYNHLTIHQKGYMANLVKNAYQNWSSLQEYDVGHEPALLTQGEFIDEYPNTHQQTITRVCTDEPEEFFNRL